MSRTVIALDPGDRHTGIALWKWDQRSEWTHEHPAAGEPDTFGFERQFEQFLESQSDCVVVVEKFELYPWKSVEQGHSEFRTSQRIGVIRWLAHSFGFECVMQQAAIKKPTARLLEACGVELRGDRHAQDAQLHLFHYLITHKVYTPSRRQG